MLEKELDSPQHPLRLPEPNKLLESVSAIKKVSIFIESFCEIIKNENRQEVIKKIGCDIFALTKVSTSNPDLVDCYKTYNQKKCDEYFFIQRTHNDAEKNFILNALIIARDVLINNSIDGYLDESQIKTALDTMSHLLSYLLTRSSHDDA